MKRLYKWNVRRSGATMTVTGFDSNKVEHCITNVRTIDLEEDGRIICRKLDDSQFQLCVGNLPSAEPPPSEDQE